MATTKAIYDHDYRIQHADRLREYDLNYYKTRRRVTSKTRYSRLKHDAKDRKLDVTITFEEYNELLNQSCFYCVGSLPLQGYGVDRIDSTLGYVHGNVRPCCYRCNCAKNNMTETEFKEWILRIYNSWAVR